MFEKLHGIDRRPELFLHQPGHAPRVLDDGDELFAALRRVCPALPVVIASGYSERELTLPPKDTDGVAFLEKPYSMQQLTAAVASVCRRTG